MKSLFKVFAVFAMMLGLLTGMAHAQDQKSTPASSGKLLFASGDFKEGSTYAIMVNELLQYCGKDFAATYTSGGVENKNLLIGNKVSVAPMQPDMLEFLRRSDPAKVANIRTLFTLHEEEVHIIATRDTLKEGGFLGFGATKKTLETMADLAGMPVGAAGGSIDTASVISATSDTKFKVMSLPDNGALKAALESGKLAAGVIVGGAQHKLVASLGPNFRLIPIPKDIQAKLVASKLYRPAKLTYPNLRAVGVDTVSVTATVVTRIYRSQEMLTKLKNLRGCFQENLSNIQDKTGTHEKWQMVDSTYKGGWPWYDLP